LEAGDAVTAAQMRALYGAGMHPVATQRPEQLRGTDLTDANIQAPTRLEAPFNISDSEPSRFRVEVANRRVQRARRTARYWPVPPGERARIRTEMARESFAAEHRRPPADARKTADDWQAFKATGADDRPLRSDVSPGEVSVHAEISPQKWCTSPSTTSLWRDVKTVIA
jgi:hypothetical protein